MSMLDGIINKVGGLSTLSGASKNQLALLQGLGNGSANLGAGLGGAASFEDALDSASKGLELALANKFLEQSIGMGNDSGSGNELGLGGMGLENIQMKLLMSAVQQGLSTTQQTAEAAPLPSIPQTANLAQPTLQPTPVVNAVAVPLEETSMPSGELSSRFESGTKGPETVSWDRTGGTSYGTYQLATKTGTFDEFLTFLDDKMPEWALALRNAQPAESSNQKDLTPKVWKDIARENPELLKELEHEFILGSHYKPALNKIADITGLDAGKLPETLKEVLFSTSVQHGATGAASIFSKALNTLRGHGPDGLFKELLGEVYALRSTQFGSSTERVREAVMNRFEEEKTLALKQLDSELA